ncbi:AAA family ATPase [Aquimarina rhabdastrellae]
MTTEKIVIIGGPSSGKTTIIDYLVANGEVCYEEVSRQIISEAQKEGVDQLFLTDPELFSQKLLEGRIQQFKDAQESDKTRVFLDRGIPDIVAYMNYVNEESPEHFIAACHDYKYDRIFILPPWKEIHITDKERYETFEQAEELYKHLLGYYSDLGYDCIEVPFDTVEKRANFILEQLKS